MDPKTGESEVDKTVENQTGSTEVNPEIQESGQVVLSKEKTPEEKERDRNGYARRHFQKNYRASLQKELEKQSQEEGERILREQGLDPADEQNKKTVLFSTKHALRTREIEDEMIQKAKAKDASEVLSQTFQDMGINPNSDEAKILGNHLFRIVGIDNPDVFQDVALVDREAQRLASGLARKKESGSITSAVIDKAATDKSVQSRVPEVPVNKKNKEAAQRYGISEAKTERFSELQSKIPSFMRVK